MTGTVRPCPHLARLLQGELEAGNRISRTGASDAGQLILLADPFIAPVLIAPRPVIESVIGHPEWWGRELHCPEHRQRLVSPL